MHLIHFGVSHAFQYTLMILTYFGVFLGIWAYFLGILAYVWATTQAAKNAALIKKQQQKCCFKKQKRQKCVQ